MRVCVGIGIEHNVFNPFCPRDALAVITLDAIDVSICAHVVITPCDPLSNCVRLRFCDSAQNAITLSLVDVEPDCVVVRDGLGTAFDES